VCVCVCVCVCVVYIIHTHTYTYKVCVKCLLNCIYLHKKAPKTFLAINSFQRQG
jgi:hypothetical protein